MKALPAACAVSAVPVLLYVTAEGFFRFTFRRAADRDLWTEGLGDKVLKDRSFFERADREAMEITSRDGLRLKAWFYDRGAEVTVILCHGYRGGPEEMSGIASALYAQGMNILLIYQRGHGLSAGSYFTMGTLEKRDLADWARKIAERKPTGRIVLFGWSMGGNTVMGAIGETLPENVCCAVEDCGYCSLREQLLFSCRRLMPRLPARNAFVALLGLHCRLFRGFSINDPRDAALGRCRIPMLFIHGSADEVVPYDNLDRCYYACTAEKRRSSYAGAPHVGSCGWDPERYFRELLAFIRSSTELQEGGDTTCTLT